MTELLVIINKKWFGNKPNQDITHNFYLTTCLKEWMHTCLKLKHQQNAVRKIACVKLIVSIKSFPPHDITLITTWVSKCIKACLIFEAPGVADVWSGTLQCLHCLFLLFIDVYQFMKFPFDEVLLWHSALFHRRQNEPCVWSSWIGLSHYRRDGR